MTCLAKDNEEYGIDLDNIEAVDYNSLKRVNAKKAFFVVGSKIKAKISKTSKLAFEKEEDAKKFIKQNGGKLMSFDEAFDLAKKSLKDDFKKLKTVNKKKIYPKGKKIFEKRCSKDIDPTDYLEINELEADIQKNNLCKKLKESQLQTVALYLWDVKRFGDLGEVKNRVVVEEHEKCPVCGMFVAKYPRWAAQIIYSHGNHEHKFSFDGVKDLMKFYFDPKRWINADSHLINKSNIKEVKVTDYYSQEAIDGREAYYVIGSDVYGPMGHELIPFKNLSDAKTFKADHSGKVIIEFNKLKEEDIYKLDE
ncbi:nitrous oxide reductase accessory protein NosL [Halarcobacter anaerophilus]|uniref:nitrous oxide reductase accessory protein NosL n=1 Tax=Halarcobacter anaerophilus TaxID=877500 RepID=UPI000697AAC4|nr:nitrous oxide reductase accessory protein NosL [Halarcobacter anaerophilus]